MTSRERMKVALSGGIPDRVPFAPDISTMIPCRLTGKKFYGVIANENPLPKIEEDEPARHLLFSEY